ISFMARWWVNRGISGGECRISSILTLSTDPYHGTVAKQGQQEDRVRPTAVSNLESQGRPAAPRDGRFGRRRPHHAVAATRPSVDLHAPGASDELEPGAGPHA